MTIRTEIATHSDGTTCAIATTTGTCDRNHTYTETAEPAEGAKGILITTAGEVIVAAFTGLADYQRAVGGWITTVELDEHHDMIANDEGLIERLPLNYRASVIAGRPLVGNVVIIGCDNTSGEFVDIDERLVARVRRTVGA